MLNLTDSDEIFTDGSDIHENEPVLTDPAPAVAESEEAVFESEEPDSEEIDIENLAAHSRDFSRELAASLNSLFQ